MANSNCKIFLGKLPCTLTENELREKAAEFGSVAQLFYMPDQLQQQQGWAFITYSTEEEAAFAVAGLDGKYKFEGYEQAAECRLANRKPAAATGATTAIPAGASSAVPANTNSPWQQYFTTDGHPYYYNSLSGVTQWERPPEMDRPSALPQQPQRVYPRHDGGGSSFGPPGANLFVFHLPNDWNDVDLIQHFQHFGDILSARIQRDSEGRNRGFGFVSFSDQRAAVHAIRGMHGFNVGGKFLKVQLKKGEESRLTPAMRSLLPSTHLPGGQFSANTGGGAGSGIGGIGGGMGVGGLTGPGYGTTPAYGGGIGAGAGGAGGFTNPAYGAPAYSQGYVAPSPAYGAAYGSSYGTGTYPPTQQMGTPMPGPGVRYSPY